MVTTENSPKIPAAFHCLSPLMVPGLALMREAPPLWSGILQGAVYLFHATVDLSNFYRQSQNDYTHF